tara:strand:- start:2201 stop:2404 length:204 start_codon:yes stop_codon:yes gene_type:complete
MRRINKKEFEINQDPPKEFDLNKIPTGCAPCLKEAIKIEKKINKRSLNEIKINEIKKIVNSIFENKK